MDRDEALKLLKGGPEGIREWNRRREDGEAIPSLEGAGLDVADLTHANLSNANLAGSHLMRASLVGADLRSANLRKSFLASAILMGAQLEGANLTSTTLVGADLTVAYVRGTNFSGALFASTKIACDISGAIGLEAVRHIQPSTVDINKCLLKLKDDLPEKFLQGCGLRDEEIAYFRGQIGKPIRFYTCFISYSTADEEFATRLHNDFQVAGIRCWKWNKDARTGKSLIGEIDDAIRVFDKLVLIASKSSLKSPAVIAEIKRAIEKEASLVKRQHNGEYDGNTNVLFPVRIDDYILHEWEHPNRTEVLDKVITDASGCDTDMAKYSQLRDKLIEDLRE